MNWSFPVATTATSKLPLDWSKQGLDMAYRVAYLVKAYSIPPQLVLNNDQTGIHLVSNAVERKWKPKGEKHVQVLGIEDKRQVTMVVTLNAVGDLLPPQVVFTGTTKRTLPPQSEGKKMCLQDGWNLTYSENHWSNLQKTKQCVDAILIPYLQQQIQELGLPKDQRMVWLLDCWSVHISKGFMKWIQVTHANILVIYVPANCTSNLKPTDVILQKSLKHAFEVHFNRWPSLTIKDQIDRGIEPEIDFWMSNLKPRLCEWLHLAWNEVKAMKSVVVKGWDLTSLTRAFDSSFQIAPMTSNSATNLFEAFTIEAINDDDVDELDSDLPIFEVVHECLQPKADCLQNIQLVVSALAGTKQRMRALARGHNTKSATTQENVSGISKKLPWHRLESKVRFWHRLQITTATSAT